MVAKETSPVFFDGVVLKDIEETMGSVIDKVNLRSTDISSYLFKKFYYHQIIKKLMLFIPQLIKHTVLCLSRWKCTSYQCDKGNILTFQNLPTVLQGTNRALPCTNSRSGSCLKYANAIQFWCKTI